MSLFVLDLAFALWLAASAINQFDWKWWSKVRAFDAFALLPKWTFFAPLPGKDDLRVVYRDLFENGTPSSWSELQTTPRRGALIHMLWNPEKLDNKAVFDLSLMFAIEVAQFESFPKAAPVALSYIQLLDAVMQPRRTYGTVARQFGVVATRGHRPPRKTEILMLSQAHPFDPA